MQKFEDFWKNLFAVLTTPKKIKNWTVKKGYFGNDFTAHAAPRNAIICTTLTGSESYASEQDFRLIYDNWEGYVSEQIPRSNFTESSRVTTYTISIIHQYLK